MVKLFMGLSTIMRPLIKRRVYEHKEKLIEGFTKKYNISKLVYYEVFRDIESVILREKQIKGGSRAKKLKLINCISSVRLN
ncbi:MAG: hypothetical protein A3F88_09575 [Deltaproteobacteria bacterium RIFCSPLOWO2_12_FULL_42_16]|nr:MAG: hypothetical protein A2090_11230 [Deltaproteobacteria bacterium GWD2_42_10]OGQ65413.1 MAG: hypothetical protein A3F88_09575 [Deltaproteobacteria bacterium RIFCSPLOWO2_12_FULL_42_16]